MSSPYSIESNSFRRSCFPVRYRYPRRASNPLAFCSRRYLRFCRRRIMRVSCALVNRDLFFRKTRQQFFDFIRLRFRLDFLGCEFMERARFLSDERASRVLTYSCCTESPTKARTSGFISSASAFVIIVVRKGMVSCIRPIISHRSGFNKKIRIDL